MRWLRFATVVTLSTVLVLTSCSSDGGSGAGSGLPGGSAGKDLLTKHNWLDDHDRLTYRENAGEPADQSAAICSYLFGKPSEVAKTAKLSGAVRLQKDSGYVTLGSNGDGFRCLYGTSSSPVFEAQVWGKKLPSSKNGGSHVVSVDLPRNLYGKIAYVPGYTKKTIDTADAKKWLTAAGGRVAGTAD